MEIYQMELQQWAISKNDPRFEKLLALDSPIKSFGGIRTPPLPRVIDKCTFVRDGFINKERIALKGKFNL